ncbi:MAG TPA: type II secretion system F family protein [Myxococcales bacterium]|nr:type II secretion system F family protein [Myxococcales bacterium]
MPKFNWEGKNRDGEIRKGVLEADSKADVVMRLETLQITPGKVTMEGGGLMAALNFGGGVDHKVLVIFSRQLATMIDAGLPLVQCLDILSGSEPNKTFKETLISIRKELEGGSTFADSLKKHPKIFDDLWVNLIAAGELGGILDTILNRLAEYTEKSMKLKAKVKGAMKYPMTILVVALVITYGLLTSVIPTFGGMFKSMGKKDLPAITEFMMGLSKSATANMPYILSGMFGLIVAYRLFVSKPKGRLIVDTLMIKSPLFGNMIRKTAVAKFTRTLGTLVSSGVPILDALDIVSKTAGNMVVEHAVIFIKEKISEGQNIAQPMLETGVFPKMVVQMIGVGEQTGAMDVMLGKIADFYDDEVDQAIDGLMAMIEPLIMVVLGGIIGSVMMAMYMPIFAMGDAMSG